MSSIASFIFGKKNSSAPTALPEVEGESELKVVTNFGKREDNDPSCPNDDEREVKSASIAEHLNEPFYLFQKETNSLMKLFPGLPDLERVLEVYSCSLNAGLSELQSQGSLYFTGQYLCFINTAGDIKEMIAFREITDLAKNATKMNTSIEIHTTHQKYLFSFFLVRDKTFNMMTLIWKNRGKSNNQYAALAASVKYAKENKTLHETFFAVSPHELVLEHYPCCLESNVNQGRIYVSNFYCIYFYSSIPFMEEKKLKIPFSTIQNITKTSGSMINSIDIQTKDNKHSFRNFLSYCDQCYNMLNSQLEKYRKRPVTFGIPLYELLARENRDNSIPKFVEAAVTFLTAAALDTEGLFRITGNLSEQEYIQLLIDEGEQVDFFSCQDKHVVAGLLKKFFRDLPSPLFTFEFHNCFLALYESKQLFDPAELLRKLKGLIKLLPHHNRKLARYMMEFLAKVSSHVVNNKMNPKNLATIWGAIFLKAAEETLDFSMLKTASEIMDLSLIMINNYNLLFSENDEEV